MYSRRLFSLVSCLIFLVSKDSVWCAEKLNALQLIELAKAQSPELRAGIEATFDGNKLKDGTAWVGHGGEFFSPWKLLQRLL
jgi:hypothetical protein